MKAVLLPATGSRPRASPLTVMSTIWTEGRGWEGRVQEREEGERKVQGPSDKSTWHVSESLGKKPYPLTVMLFLDELKPS